jgi:uncharacterized glyoxalase superfamily protein PhnB
MEKVEFILYVHNAKVASNFYEAVFQKKPFNVDAGITEFELTSNCVLGLMPEANISKILQPIMPHPSQANGIPRCELYLYVDSPEDYLQRAFDAGAVLISPNQRRDWGDEVGYCADPDGHVVAFAKKIG